MSTIKTPKEIFKSVYYPRLFELEKKFIEIIPEVVFHYTNITSFIEIFTSKKLWASRSEFLNDMSEFRYGQHIAAEQASKLGSIDEYSSFAARLKEAIAGPIEAPFIACFCRDGDLLSQWRGYSNHGQGLSVGFRSRLLNSVAGARINTVVYEPEMQETLLFDHMKILADAYSAVGLDLSDHETYRELVGYTGNIERCCALVKDPAFKEEGEVRCVVPDFNIASNKYDIEYRVRNNLIVPYIELDLGTIWDKAVSEIIVGPGPDRDIRKRNIEHFLDLIGVHTTVRFSNCQFR